MNATQFLALNSDDQFLDTDRLRQVVSNALRRSDLGDRDIALVGQDGVEILSADLN